jgi:hypothetical protein
MKMSFEDLTALVMRAAVKGHAIKRNLHLNVGNTTYLARLPAREGEPPFSAVLSEAGPDPRHPYVGAKLKFALVNTSAKERRTDMQCLEEFIASEGHDISPNLPGRHPQRPLAINPGTGEEYAINTIANRVFNGIYAYAEKFPNDEYIVNGSGVPFLQTEVGRSLMECARNRDFLPFYLLCPALLLQGTWGSNRINGKQLQYGAKIAHSITSGVVLSEVTYGGGFNQFRSHDPLELSSVGLFMEKEGAITGYHFDPNTTKKERDAAKAGTKAGAKKAEKKKAPEGYVKPTQLSFSGSLGGDGKVRAGNKPTLSTQVYSETGIADYLWDLSPCGLRNQPFRHPKTKADVGPVIRCNLIAMAILGNVLRVDKGFFLRSGSHATIEETADQQSFRFYFADTGRNSINVEISVEEAIALWRWSYEQVAAADIEWYGTMPLYLNDKVREAAKNSYYLVDEVFDGSATATPENPLDEVEEDDD